MYRLVVLLVCLASGLLIPLGGFAAEGSLRTVVVGHAANFSNVSRSAINPYNNAVSNGLEFALAEYQQKLKARNIEVKIQNFDYGNSEIQAIDAAKLIVASSAVAAIGFYESGQSLLGSPILEEAGVALISPMSSATRLFGKGPHFHPMSFSNQTMGEALADFARRNFKAKTALVVAAADCAYCSDLGNAFASSAEKLKIAVSKHDVLNDLPSFDGLDAATKGKRFDVIVVPNHELTSAKIIAHLMKSEFKGPFLGGDGWGNAQGMGLFQIVSDQKFVGYSIGHWHPDLSTPVGKQFVRSWKKKFGKIPSADSTMAYDSMRRLIFALLEAKEITRDGVQASLMKLKRYNGATGDLSFVGPGQPPKKAIIVLKSDMKKKSFVPIRFFTPEPAL